MAARNVLAPSFPLKMIGTLQLYIPTWQLTGIRTETVICVQKIYDQCLIARCGGFVVMGMSGRLPLMPDHLGVDVHIAMVGTLQKKIIWQINIQSY